MSVPDGHVTSRYGGLQSFSQPSDEQNVDIPVPRGGPHGFLPTQSPAQHSVRAKCVEFL